MYRRSEYNLRKASGTSGKRATADLRDAVGRNQKLFTSYISTNQTSQIQFITFMLHLDTPYL